MTDTFEEQETREIKLLRVTDNQVVNAEIVSLSSKHLDDFTTFWKPRLSGTKEEDSHWDWAIKLQLTNELVSYESYAVEASFITQGLMLIEIDLHRSRINPQKSLVYIDFLATAPWNRKSIEGEPQYKGVGSALYRFAIQRSLDLGYKGRISLHSLPEAEAFYRQQKLQDLGTDPEKQNLRYFEFSEMSMS